MKFTVPAFLLRSRISMAHLKVLVFTLISFYFHRSESIKCLSCNSEKENQCSDLFEFNYTSSGSSSIPIIDCSNEEANRQLIEYFSNLMSVFGVPVEVNTKFSTKLAKKQKKRQACQKVIINDESGQIVIRDCAVLSEIVCDSLKIDAESYISFCDVCDTDYCNYSAKSVINWSLLVIAVFVSSIFNYHILGSHIYNV